MNITTIPGTLLKTKISPFKGPLRWFSLSPDKICEFPEGYALNAFLPDWNFYITLGGFLCSVLSRSFLGRVGQRHSMHSGYSACINACATWPSEGLPYHPYPSQQAGIWRIMLQGLLIQSHVMSHVDVFALNLISDKLWGSRLRLAGGPNVQKESIFWERGLPGT